MELVTLKDVNVKSKVKVLGIRPESRIKRKLLDMGITKSTKITVDGKAPMGDPMSITVRGYHLILRSNEAKDILVEVG